MTLGDVKDAICITFKIEMAALKSSRRGEAVVPARVAFAHMCDVHLGMKQGDVADQINKNSSVMNYYKNEHNRRMDYDHSYKRKMCMVYDSIGISRDNSITWMDPNDVIMSCMAHIGIDMPALIGDSQAYKDKTRRLRAISCQAMKEFSMMSNHDITMITHTHPRWICEDLPERHERFMSEVSYRRAWSNIRKGCEEELKVRL